MSGRRCFICDAPLPPGCDAVLALLPGIDAAVLLCAGCAERQQNLSG